MKKQRGAIKAENDAQIQSFRDALGIKTEGGKVDDKAIRYDDLHPSDPRRAVVEFTKVVAQATGRNFVFFRSTAKEQAKGKENGRYEPETNTIYIDINAGINELEKVLTDQVLPTVSHELVHIFAVEDPAGFASLSELVFEGLTKAEGKTRSFLISKEIQRINEADEKRLAGKSEDTIRAIAEEEIVARACEDRLENSRLMKEFIEEMERKESELAQKFSNILGEAIKCLKEIFRQIASKLSRSHEAIQLRNLTTELEAIQKQYDALLERRTTEATTAPSEQQKNTYDRGVMNAERSFSYDELISKGSLKGVVVDKTQHPKMVNGIIDDKWVVKKVREKCKTLTRKGGIVYYTNVPNIGRNVEIIAKGLTHGFSRPTDRKNKQSTENAITNARVTLAIPQILNNSIEVNRSQRGNNSDVPYTHVLIGTVALENDDGTFEHYAVRSMVQERKNQNPVLVEADVLGKLTSVNAKKIGSPTTQVGKNTVAVVDGEAYEYNISDFLNDVKGVFKGTFSEDVYQHLGATRTDDDFSKNLMFADRATYMTAREILMQFAMFDFEPSYQSRRSRVSHQFRMELNIIKTLVLYIIVAKDLLCTSSL